MTYGTARLRWLAAAITLCIALTGLTVAAQRKPVPASGQELADAAARLYERARVIVRHVEASELDAGSLQELAEVRRRLARFRAAVSRQDPPSLFERYALALAAYDAARQLAHRLYRIGAYLDAVWLYRRGAVSSAAVAVAGWTPADLQDIGALLVDLVDTDAQTVASAALLHTEIALRGPTVVRPEPAHSRLHLEVAGRLLASAGGRLPEGFDAKWTLAGALHLASVGLFREALEAVEPAIARHPADPDLVTAKGALCEALASPLAQTPRMLRATFGTNRGGPADGSREWLGVAERAFRDALRLRSDHEEAHLRLGRVLAERGRQAEAVEHLDVAGRSKVKAVSYLARLFIARLRGEQGNWTDAAAAYEEAVGILPGCQAASWGLSGARRRLGVAEEGTAEVRAIMAEAAGPAACDEPWWTYVFGPNWRFSELVESLRSEVRRCDG